MNGLDVGRNYTMDLGRNAMNKPTNRGERVRFGTFELNVRTGELVPIGAVPAEAGAAKALLREQPFQILRILVERQGNIVTRQEIQQILWPDDTVVEFDRSINAAMVILRKALADDADHPKYIETLARRGYRLIAPVEWQQPAQDLLELRADTLPRIEGQISEPEPRAPKHWRKAAVLGSSVIILVVVGYLSWRHFRAITPRKTERITLAVLPFENLTGDPNKEYLADGLTEETISQLGQLDPDQLGVIARTSVMEYKHSKERLEQIGRDLSVQYVLENSLRQSGDHIRVTVQLIKVKDQSHLWSHDYDYRPQDILALQDQVAKAVVGEIQLRLNPQQRADLTRSQSVNPEAFDAYLQGYYFFQRSTDKDADMAAKYFERAIQFDPSYAFAWAYLSRARNWQANKGLIPIEEGRRLSREAVERALSLNPNLAEAHAQMGRIKQQIDFDWSGADASYQRAVQLEPGNPEVVRSAAFSGAMLGRFDEAVQLARRAVDLDPLNADSWEELGEIEFLAGQLDEATAKSKKALELKPDVWPGPIQLSQIYVLQGRPKDALPEIERVRSEPSRAFLYAIAYHALGREKESEVALRELIEKYHTSMACQIAQVYGFRNQSEEAFGWLDRAYAQRDAGLIGTKVEPLLKSLHNDPRFAAFLKRLNLPN
jgi:TolB-like protein/DNA-binding winged helix-turn-helix (wHTH) protein/Tfp pilus assembly protein PilF